jgi:hypothetical protein
MGLIFDPSEKNLLTRPPLRSTIREADYYLVTALVDQRNARAAIGDFHEQQPKESRGLMCLRYARREHLWIPSKSLTFPDFLAVRINGGDDARAGKTHS